MEKKAVISITREVWTTMLGEEVRLSERSAEKVELEASVRIDGAWTGIVTIGVPQSLAKTAAAAMLGGTPDDMSPDDVHDALGEIANMIGGSLKSLLPGPNQLGLPQVEKARVDPPTVPQDEHVFLDCLDTDFVVTIRREASDKPGESAA